jgi:hypothetical protein
MGFYFRTPPRWASNPPLWFLAFGWVAGVAGVALMLAGLPPVVSGIGELAAYRGDTSCSTDLTSSSRPAGACTVSDPKIATSSFEDRDEMVAYGRGVTSVHVQHYYVEVTLPDGKKHVLDVSQDLYNKALVDVKPVTISGGITLFQTTRRALIFKERIVRLAIDDTVSETSESPSWRIGDEVVVPLIGAFVALIFLPWAIKMTRKRRAAKAA